MRPEGQDRDLVISSVQRFIGLHGAPADLKSVGGTYCPINDELGNYKVPARPSSIPYFTLNALIPG